MRDIKTQQTKESPLKEQESDRGKILAKIVALEMMAETYKHSPEIRKMYLDMAKDLRKSLKE